jgi:hypothetical protein
MVTSENRKTERGTVFRYFLSTGEARWGFIYDGPPRPERPRNQISVKGFKSESDAIVALHAATTKQDTGVARPLSDPNQTLSELFAQWMEEYARRKLGRKTVERYGTLADYVLPRLGHIPFRSSTCSRLKRSLMILPRCRASVDVPCRRSRSG